MKSLRLKILEIANEVQLAKDGNNSFQKFKYTTLDLIKSKLKPLLLKYGVFYHYSVNKLSDDWSEAVLTIYDLDSDAIEVYKMHAKDIEINSNPVQGAGSFRTYTTKYLLRDAFMLEASDDDPDSIDGSKITSGSRVLSSRKSSAAVGMPPRAVVESLDSVGLPFAAGSELAARSRKEQAVPAAKSGGTDGDSSLIACSGSLQMSAEQQAFYSKQQNGVVK